VHEVKQVQCNQPLIIF